jgi:hypothetical protein
MEKIPCLLSHERWGVSGVPSAPPFGKSTDDAFSTGRLGTRFSGDLFLFGRSLKTPSRSVYLLRPCYPVSVWAVSFTAFNTGGTFRALIGDSL